VQRNVGSRETKRAAAAIEKLALAEEALAEAVNLEFSLRFEDAALVAKEALLMLRDLDAPSSLEARVSDAVVVGGTIAVGSFRAEDIDQVLISAGELVDRAGCMTGVRPSSRIEAHIARGWVRSFHPGLLDEALRDFLRAAQIAQQCGMPNLQIRGAHRAAALCTLRGDPRRAVSILKPLLELSRVAGSPETRAATLSEIAKAFLESGHPGDSLAPLRELRTVLPAHHFLVGSSFQQEAMALLRMRQASPALEKAGEAVLAFSRINSAKDLAAAMHVEALALAALGRRALAMNRLSEALEAGAQVTHPIALARMRYDRSRLLGDRAAAAAARREMRTFAH